MTIWANEIDNIKKYLDEGLTLDKIGDKYNVSKQRMYQILQKFDIPTPKFLRKSYLRGKPTKYHWLNRMLISKKFTAVEKLKLIQSLDIPDVCPILNIPLNYDGVEFATGRNDNSPSIDRIDSSIGYTADNIHIISWRANRIKNDSTPEELIKIANYFAHLTK